MLPARSPQTPVLASLIGIRSTRYVRGIYRIYKTSEARTGVWGGTQGGGMGVRSFRSILTYSRPIPYTHRLRRPIKIRPDPPPKVFQAPLDPAVSCPGPVESGLPGPGPVRPRPVVAHSRGGEYGAGAVRSQRGLFLGHRSRRSSQARIQPSSNGCNSQPSLTIK